MSTESDTMRPSRRQAVGVTLEFSAWQDLGLGYQVRRCINDPRQEVRTPAGHVLVSGRSTTERPYFELEGPNPLTPGATRWVDQALADLGRLGFTFEYHPDGLLA